MRIEGNDQRLAAATAIQLQNSGVQQMLAPKTAQHQEAKASSKEDAVQSLAGDKVSIRVELPKNTVDTLQKMGNISDFLNSVATNLRQTNEGLKSVNNIVEQMKASLDKIIKNYPPFSLESRDRMELLMSYASLKEQILRMMVPAPPAPIYEDVKHLWDGLTNGQNSIQTPSLPVNAPDSHVAAAAKQLDAVSSQIGLVQDAMGKSFRAV